jgi:alpha-ribazole phosphatase
MRLYLVRHARPDVDTGICYGSTDLHVAPEEHAGVLATLTPALPKSLPVFSSPLRRCGELAVQLAAALDSGAVIHDARLVEIHFGAWEMRAWNDIPRAEIDAWSADLHTYRPGGGESVLQAAQRVHAFLEDLRRRQLDSAIVVCHAGTIRLLTACREHASPLDAALHAARTSHKIGYGELILLDC